MDKTSSPPIRAAEPNKAEAHEGSSRRLQYTSEAASHVLGLYETCEQIMLYLDYPDLFACLRVSRAIRSTIKTSKRLRQAVWLDMKHPYIPAWDPPHCEPVPETNPFFHRLLRETKQGEVRTYGTGLRLTFDVFSLSHALATWAHSLPPSASQSLAWTPMSRKWKFRIRVSRCELVQGFWSTDDEEMPRAPGWISRYINMEDVQKMSVFDVMEMLRKELKNIEQVLPPWELEGTRFRAWVWAWVSPNDASAA